MNAVIWYRLGTLRYTLEILQNFVTNCPQGHYKCMSGALLHYARLIEQEREVANRCLSTNLSSSIACYRLLVSIDLCEVWGHCKFSRIARIMI